MKGVFMLRSSKSLMGCILHAIDGEIGKSNDFLFDDENFKIRYLVANTSKWLPSRKVLISPRSIKNQIEEHDTLLPVNLTKEKIKNSPDLSLHEPVSRQHEAEYLSYYDFPFYWESHIINELSKDSQVSGIPTKQHHQDNIHLRSIDEIIGYRIEAKDGQIGHVEDFIIDDKNWKIRYLVVDTRDWLPGKNVLLIRSQIKSICWSTHHVLVNITKDQVKSSPAYDPFKPVNRDKEKHLYDYYGRPYYW